jgi:hypothetical protein
VTTAAAAAVALSLPGGECRPGAIGELKGGHHADEADSCPLAHVRLKLPRAEALTCLSKCGNSSNADFAQRRPTLPRPNETRILGGGLLVSGIGQTACHSRVMDQQVVKLTRGACQSMNQVQKYLAQANRHIAELVVQIAHQRVIVRQMLDTGQGSEMAESLLDALEGSVRIFEKHRIFLLSIMQPATSANGQSLSRCNGQGEAIQEVQERSGGDGSKVTVGLNGHGLSAGPHH